MLVLLLLAHPAVHGENVETLAERSHTQASAVLERAVQALGGPETLRGIDVVRLRLEGDTWTRFQMSTPEPPFEGGRLRETVLIDFKNNRLLLEQFASGAGFENHNGVVINAGEGVAYDHRARTMTPIPGSQSSQQQFVQYYRRIPHLLLRQAIDRPTTLRYLGTENFHGKPHEAFTFVMADTQQVAVYVDSSTHLVSKYELLFTDNLAGDDVSEIVFGNYVTAGAQRVPTTWTWMQAGEKVADAKISVELNPNVTDQSFKVAADGYQRVAALPDTLPPQVETLAEGVYVVHNVAGQNQNTMAVEFADFIVAVEAPGSSDGADQVIERIKQTIPGKPIRYVAMTHHHGDHIGGLRSFIAEGATIITTRANRRIVEAMANAPQRDRLARNPRAPQFEFVEKGRRVLSDRTQRLELVDVGPNPHAKEMLVGYLPKQRVLFQGDLFFAPPNDAPAGPPQESTLSFARRLAELGLKVDRIASVHGRTATKEEFDRAAKLPANRVVYDLGHGQTSVIRQMPEMARKLGHEIHAVQGPLGADTLRGAALLYLRTPTRPYTPEEKKAVIDLVRAGGSLLLVLDEELRTELATGVNDMLAPFGLALTADAEYLHNTGGIAKAGVVNRADRELPYSGGRGVTGGKAFAWQLDRDGKPAQPFASHAEVGKARIVVMGEAMASAFLGTAEGVRLSGAPRDPQNTVFWGKDSSPFMEEVLEWLLKKR